MKKIISLIIFCISLVSYAQVTNGLVGHWPLDGNANDVINSNNGIITGAQPTIDRNGNLNAAYSFEISNYIQLGDPIELDLRDSFTVSTWVNRIKNTDNWDNAVIGKWNVGSTPGSNEWILTLSSGDNDNYPFFIIEIGSTQYSVASTTELNINEWYHISAVRRDTTIEIYVNGVMTGITSVPNQPINDSGRNLEIARFANGFYLDGGKIDDIKMFDRALSQNEIVQLYNETSVVELHPDLYCVDGNIGIGTDNTFGYKLAVKGDIIAEEIKVQVYPWSDFVFEDDYELPTIAEVEKHIKEKGHLQHIPSAEEVAKNGIYLGEMDAKLLQKIEELTLYTIEQDKEIKAQEVFISKLEALMEDKEKK